MNTSIWKLAFLGEAMISFGIAISVYVSYGQLIPAFSGLCIAGGASILLNVIIFVLEQL